MTSLGQAIAAKNSDRSLAEIVRRRELMNSIHREQEANRNLDHVELEICDGTITPEEIDEAFKDGVEQIVETQNFLRRLETFRRPTAT